MLLSGIIFVSIEGIKQEFFVLNKTAQSAIKHAAKSEMSHENGVLE